METPVLDAPRRGATFAPARAPFYIESEVRHAGGMRLRWPLLSLAMLAGCESTPPRFAFPDGGADASIAHDGSSSDASATRPDGSTLPPADVEVVVPYGGAPATTTLTLVAAPPKLDVHLSIDTTGSFGGEIAELQRSLVSTVIPGIRAKVPDTSFGVSRFEDFPTHPYGEPTDRPFTLVSGITNDTSRVTAAVGSLDQPLGNGGDVPEAGYEALYQIGTGAGFVADGVTLVAPFAKTALPGGGTLGGVGFRADAFHAVVHVTDAPSHVPPDYLPTYTQVHGYDDVVGAFSALDVRALGIASGDAARPQLEALAVATGATTEPVGGTCPTGLAGASRPPSGGVCPLVFDVSADGTGLSSTLLGSLISLVDAIRWNSAGSAVLDDRLGFVQSIRAASAVPPAGAPVPSTADVSPVDGIPDTFLDVRSSTRLSFEVTLANNLFPELDYEQIFLVTVALVADGATIDTTTIRIVVPARPLATDASVPTP